MFARKEHFVVLLILFYVNLTNSSASQCSPNQFQCKDGGCIPLELLCNENEDCADQSDEGDKCGMGTIFDSVTRHFLEKCQVLDFCSQKCEIAGKYSHKCSCLPNFKLNLDNRTCRAVTTQPSWIYYSTREALWKLNPQNGIQFQVQNNLVKCFAVAADHEFVYWSSGETGTKRIYGQRVDGSSAIKTMSLGDTGYVYDLAVDWWTGNLYYTCANPNQIRVIGSAQNKFLVLISKDLKKPEGIVLHPSSGRMFWSDYGSDPYIGVAFMDGQGQRRIIERDIKGVYRLAIDEARERLYWVDYYLGKLESTTFEGYDRRLIKHDPSWAAVALGVLDDELLTRNDTNLIALEKFKGGNERTILKAYVVALSIVHPLIQGRNYDQENPCQKYPCSYMCLLAGNGRRTCVCGEDNRLDNGTECGEVQNSDLLIGFNDTLQLVKFQNDKVLSITNLFPAVSPGVYNIDVLASDPSTGDIYVADNSQRKIFLISPESNKTTQIVYDTGKVSSMVFAQATNQLIFTEYFKDLVYVYDVTNNTQGIDIPTLHKFPEKSVPLAIVLAPKTRRLFVAVNKSPMKIMQLSMDGSNSTFLDLNWNVDSYDSNVTLTIDEKNSMLYASLGQRVMAYDYELKVETELMKLPSKANHMVLLPDSGMFYWTGVDGFVYDKDGHKIVEGMKFGMKRISNAIVPMIAYKSRKFVETDPTSTSTTETTIRTSTTTITPSSTTAQEIFTSTETTPPITTTESSSSSPISISSRTPTTRTKWSSTFENVRLTANSVRQPSSLGPAPDSTAALVALIARLEATILAQTQLITKLVEQNMALVAALAPAAKCAGGI